MFRRSLMLTGVAVLLLWPAFAVRVHALAQSSPAVSIPQLDADSMTLVPTKNGMRSIAKGHGTFSLILLPKASGKPSYLVNGAADLITYTKGKTQEIQMNSVNGKGAPVVTLTNQATQAVTTLTGSTIDYQVESGKLKVTDNVKAQSAQNSLLFTCRRLEATVTSLGGLTEMVAYDNINFSAVGKSTKTNEVRYQYAGKAELMTYVPEADNRVAHLKTANGIKPTLVITDIKTQTPFTVSGRNDINLCLDPISEESTPDTQKGTP